MLYRSCNLSVSDLHVGMSRCVEFGAEMCCALMPICVDLFTSLVCLLVLTSVLLLG